MHSCIDIRARLRSVTIISTGRTSGQFRVSYDFGPECRFSGHSKPGTSALPERFGSMNTPCL